MESVIATAPGTTPQPVTPLLSDEGPDAAMQFAERRRGCTMWLPASAARPEAEAR